MVPTASLLMIVLNLVLGFVVPIGLAWWMVRKYQAKWSTILIGAATFFVFVLVLEALVHGVVLKGPHGAAIQGNLWYYALYGGLMAGLFEETGRFLAMKFLLKKEPSTALPGIAYGIGHGGAEMLFVFGMTMVSSLAMAVMVNAGQADTLLGQAPAEAQAQVGEQIDKLVASKPGDYPVGARIGPDPATEPFRPRLAGRPQRRPLALALPRRHPPPCRSRCRHRPPLQVRRHGRPRTPRLCRSPRRRRPRLAARQEGLPVNETHSHHAANCPFAGFPFTVMAR